MGMNYTDEINYFHWKNLILKTISKEWITRPYSWMLAGVKKAPEQKQGRSVEEDLDEGGMELIEKVLHEDKENLEQKVGRFSLQIKVNSMKVKFKADI